MKSATFPALKWLCRLLGALCFVTALFMAAAPLILLLPDATLVRTDAPGGVTVTVRRSEPSAASTAESGDAAQRPPYRVEERRAVDAPRSGRLALAVLLMVPTLFIVWGLLSGWRSFVHIERGRFFDRRVIVGVRNLAVGLFGYLALQPALRLLLAPFIEPIFQEAGGPTYESRVLVNADVMLMLVFAGVTAVIAQVLTRAAEIAEDNAQIV